MERIAAEEHEKQRIEAEKQEALKAEEERLKAEQDAKDLAEK